MASIASITLGQITFFFLQMNIKNGHSEFVQSEFVSNFAIFSCFFSLECKCCPKVCSKTILRKIIFDKQNFYSAELKNSITKNL